MSAENLLRSISHKYLYFNRVDSYIDFPGADRHDGQQLPKDRQGNALAKFLKARDFSAADYYVQSRGRTYACCLSLENSDFIWSNYATDTKIGKVCVVFEFGKLRAVLNRTLQAESAAIEYNGNRCHQIFSVNYGIVEYVEWRDHQANTPYPPNPIEYIYLKDSSFSEDKELRISLSALGIGQFVLLDGTKIDFPASLQMFFDCKAAIADGTIQRILHAPDCDSGLLCTELHKLGIIPE